MFIGRPALARQYGAGDLTNDDALELFDRFVASPGVEYREEAAGLFTLWRQLAGRPVAAPKAWMDAYLAAFATASGLKFITLDQDFTAYETAGLNVLTLRTS